MPAPEYQRELGWSALRGDDPEGVLPARADLAGEGHAEAGVAVGVEGQLFPVQPHLGAAVNPFELQNHVPVRPLRRGVQDLLVDIVAALKPARVGPAGGLGRAGLSEHGVVGEGDGDSLVLLTQVGDGPASRK